MKGLLIAALTAAIATPAQATPTPAERARAKAAYQEGVAAFQQGAYTDAIVAFNTANRLDPSPTLIYNMARAFEKMGSYQSAIDHYEKYLATGAATERERETIPASLETLRRLAKDQAAADARTQPAEVTTRVVVERTDWTTPIGWGLVATGAAGLAVGSAFFLAGDGRADEASKLGPADVSKFQSLREEHDDFMLSGKIAAGVGGAVLATGLAMLLWPEADRPVVVSPGPTGISLSGSF